MDQGPGQELTFQEFCAFRNELFNMCSLNQSCLTRGASSTFQETLPGFKWIGSRIKDLLEHGKEVLFAFEESIGM